MTSSPPRASDGRTRPHPSLEPGPLRLLPGLSKLTAPRGVVQVPSFPELPPTHTSPTSHPERETTMSIFISYNHKDSEFAERLALELTSRDIKVWKDSWRIGVGDSLIEKVQDGLEGARFFCVVFSKNSLASEWVKREITAGLLRERSRNAGS